jgi:hypothetical protein
MTSNELRAKLKNETQVEVIQREKHTYRPNHEILARISVDDPELFADALKI